MVEGVEGGSGFGNPRNCGEDCGTGAMTLSGVSCQGRTLAPNSLLPSASLWSSQMPKHKESMDPSNVSHTGASQGSEQGEDPCTVAP